MEVKTAKASDSEIYSEIELNLDNVPKSKRRAVARDVGEFLKEQTLLSLASAKSPVSRAPYKSTLSKDYREEKIKAGRGGRANMEFEGDMLDSLEYKVTDNGLRIGHFDASQAPKADGHNNFSGRSTLPKRQYLPEESQKYKADIDREVRRIIAENSVQSKAISDSKLRSVQTQADFWRVLRSAYPDTSKADILAVVTRNDALVDRLSGFGLLKWLR